jgi:hypothetical protein
VVAYHQICSQLRPDDRIYFGDAAHFRHNAETTYSWSEVGNPPVIPTNSGRTHYNVIGVYCVQTHESFFIQTPDNINSAKVIELLKVLQENHLAPVRIYVILDNARSHHSKDVKTYVDKVENGIYQQNCFLLILTRFQCYNSDQLFIGISQWTHSS